MTGYLSTLLITILLVVLVLWVFMRVGTPVYRVERDNIVKLLHMVLAEQATESDWDVFIGVPIRHDPELERIREQCEDITAREYVGGKHLFSARGLEELAEVLEALERGSDSTSI